jgi:hypothetical protein
MKSRPTSESPPPTLPITPPSPPHDSTATPASIERRETGAGAGWTHLGAFMYRVPSRRPAPTQPSRW